MLRTSTGLGTLIGRSLRSGCLYPYQIARNLHLCRTLGLDCSKVGVRFLHNPGALARLEKLQACHGEIYPRISSRSEHVSCQTFVDRYSGLPSGGSHVETKVILYGRVTALRSFGSRLYFVDVKQEGRKVQTICNHARLSGTNIDKKGFKDSFRNLQMGDSLKLEGYPHRTASGELSLLLDEVPQIVSPCLPPLPIGLQNKQTRMRHRHVDFLVNPDTAGLIRSRSLITQYVRQFLLDDDQLEVQTPILADEAGGASARPFRTTATEFAGRRLAMRVAPELWLKRLAIGGFERVFEIGPSFRNEGIDLTHNPEFTTCEFYRAFTDISELRRITERLLSGLADYLQRIVKEGKIPSIPSIPNFESPFKTIDFVPALESAMDRTLPDLSSTSAEVKVKGLAEELSVELPEGANLSAMLDRLGAVYLEAQCQHPTFIINHPECMSPLAKTFVHPQTAQRVSARAELFVNHTEIANMYEEENSPVEQRRKFSIQAQEQHPESNKSSINEEYLEALEWGLPPTGGWGAGIERLCMLMTGSDRINDVLAFGSLRNVIGRRISKSTSSSNVEENMSG